MLVRLGTADTTAPMPSDILRASRMEAGRTTIDHSDGCGVVFCRDDEHRIKHLEILKPSLVAVLTPEGRRRTDLVRLRGASLKAEGDRTLIDFDEHANREDIGLCCPRRPCRIDV